MLALVLDEPPPPPPPPPEPLFDAPGAAVVPEPERVVPLVAVLALDEVLEAVLTLPRTEELVWLFEALDRLDDVLTEERAELAEPFVVEEDERAELEAAEVPTPVVEDGVRRLLPEDAVDPAPAPEEEPAVFDATAATVPLVEPWI